MVKDGKYYAELVEKYCAPNYEPIPVVLSRAEGIYAYDIDGKKYMDMLSAYSALSHGHRHPEIIRALIEQCEKLTLTSRAFHNDKLGEFLKKMCELTGFERALPMNTGAEAVETALKAMRKWAYEVKGVRRESARIIAASNNFHGRTIGVISMSTKGPSRENFGPLLPCVDIVPFNDAAALEAAITEDTACFIVEPIQGEGGVIVPDDDYLPKVREICDKCNILLCIDEIQTGLGRTGKMFCFEHYGVRPDVLTIGKALGGGVYPVSLVCAGAEILSLMKPGTHGSTFGGNPVAAAVGMASIDILIKEKLVERCADSGAYLMKKLAEMKLKNVTEIRGKGLLIGVEFAKPVAHEAAISLMEAGILAKDARPTTIRFAPPLIITREQIDEALVIIEKVFSSLPD